MKFLNNIVAPVASVVADGLMSSSDKNKMNNLMTISAGNGLVTSYPGGDIVTIAHRTGTVYDHLPDHEGPFSNTKRLQVATSGVVTWETNSVPFTGTLIGNPMAWQGSVAPFTYQMNVSGMTAGMTPVISLDFSSGTWADNLLMEKAWDYIKRAVSGSGVIVFYASEIPTVDIKIKGDIL